MTSFHPNKEKKKENRNGEKGFIHLNVLVECFNFKRSFSHFCFLCLMFLGVYSNSGFPSQAQIADSFVKSPTLKKCWENPTISKSLSIASDNLRDVYLLTEENKIQSIAAVNGNINWVFENGGNYISEILFSGKSLYVGVIAETAEAAENKPEENANHSIVDKKGSGDVQKELRVRKIYLRSVGINGGIPEWSSETEIKDRILMDGKKSSEESDGKIYLGRSENDVFLLDSGGNLFFAKNNDEKSLKLAKKFDTNVRNFFDFGAGKNNTQTDRRKTFAFYGDNKRFYILEARTGEVLANMAQPFAVTSAASVSASEIIIGDEKGNISLINFGDGKTTSVVWKVKTGGGVTSLSLTSEGILVTSLDNFVYLVDSYKGNRIWKKRLSGRLLHEPSIIENENLFVVVENDSAYFIELKNGSIVNRLTLADDTYFINSPVAIKRFYIFPTNSGIVAYSDSSCS